MINPWGDEKLADLLRQLYDFQQRERRDEGEPAFARDYFAMNFTIFFGPMAWSYLTHLPRDETGTMSWRVGHYERVPGREEPVRHQEVATLTAPRQRMIYTRQDRERARMVDTIMIFEMAGYLDEHLRPPWSWRVADSQGFTVLMGDWA